VRRYRIKSAENDTLLEDKIIFICLVQDAIGEIANCEEGTYEWVALSRLSDYLTKPYSDVQEIVEIILNYQGELNYVDKDVVVADF
jgi:hypothetical protein